MRLRCLRAVRVHGCTSFGHVQGYPGLWGDLFLDPCRNGPDLADYNVSDFWERQDEASGRTPIEFTFGNNQRTKSISHALLPGYVDGSECDFPVSVVDEVAPLLLGMEFLNYF